MISIPLVVNTHSKNSDLWPAFYGRLRQYWVGPVITFVNGNLMSSLKRELQGLYYDHEIILYKNKDRFRTQYLECLKKIPKKYDAVIIANEDYILTGSVNLDVIENDYRMLSNSDVYSVFRYVTGPQSIISPIADNLEYIEISNETPYIFSQTFSIWMLNDFIALHEETPDSDIAGSDMNQQFEVLANDTFCDLELRCMSRFHNDAKQIGSYHNECIEIPHICTAIIKGKWNMREYREELESVFKEFDIDPSIRGTA